MHDALAVVAFAAISIWLHYLGSDLWWLLVVVAAHFFLFCNVFRIIRRYELIWAGLFILNVTCWLWLERFAWPNIVLSQLPATIILIGLGIKNPGYHGIYANRYNPTLNAYLGGKI